MCVVSKNEMLLKDFIINADYGKFMSKVSEKALLRLHY